MKKLIKILVCFLVVFGAQNVYGFEKVEEHKYEYRLNKWSPKQKTINYKFRISDKEMMKNVYFVKRKLDGDANFRIVKEEFTKTYYFLKVRLSKNPRHGIEDVKLKITLIKSDEIPEIPVLGRPDRDKIVFKIACVGSIAPEICWKGDEGEVVVFKLYKADYVKKSEFLWQCAVTKRSYVQLPAELLNNDGLHEVQVLLSNEAGKFSEPITLLFSVKSELSVAEGDY